MAFLTIAGVGYPVDVAGGATEREPEYVGEKVRAFDNTLRSTRMQPKRSWEFPLAPLSEAAYNTLRAAIANDAEVAVNGDAVDNVSTTCIVTFASAGFLDHRPPAGLSFQRGVRVLAEQV